MPLLTKAIKLTNSPAPHPTKHTAFSGHPFTTSLVTVNLFSLSSSWVPLESPPFVESLYQLYALLGSRQASHPLHPVPLSCPALPLPRPEFHYGYITSRSHAVGAAATDAVC